MIVVDTSVWVEFFRQTGSSVAAHLRALAGSRARLAITEVVLMEVLAGARSARDLHYLRSRLLALPILPLRGVEGYEAAVDLYRACRSAGETVRQLTDCLVAVPTIEAGATLLHADRDFEILARHTPLRLERVAA